MVRMLWVASEIRAKLGEAIKSERHPPAVGLEAAGASEVEDHHSSAQPTLHCAGHPDLRRVDPSVRVGSAQPCSEECGRATEALPLSAVGFKPLQLRPEDFETWPPTQFLAEGIPEELGVPPPGVEIV